MECFVVYNIVMDTTHYNIGTTHGKKAAAVVKTAPVAIVAYPAGFCVGFIKAFLPKKKAAQQPQKETQQPQEIEVEVVA